MSIPIQPSRAVGRRKIFSGKRAAVVLAAGLLSTSTLATILLAPPVSAQAPPSTDIYLADLGDSPAGVTLSSPVNLTDRAGYDNQPAFSPDGSELYYTSESDGQTDIWIIDLESKAKRRLAETPESEYSPTPMPEVAALSVIRVEADGSQRLWGLPLDGGEPDVILENVKPVGYHAWSGRELVLFVLDEPHRLVRVNGNERRAEGRTVASDIGRALHAVPGADAYSFVHKAGDDGWWVKKLAIEGDRIEPVAKLFDGREDVTWSPDGRLWTADGAKIYRFCPDCGDGWIQVADLADQGIGEITRMAISPDGDRLAFVANRTEAAE